MEANDPAQFTKQSLGNQGLLGVAEASSMKLACKTAQGTNEGLTGAEIVDFPNNSGGGSGGGGGGGDGDGPPGKGGGVASTSLIIGTTGVEVIWRFGLGLGAGGGGGGATIDLNSSSEAGVGVAEVETLSFSIFSVRSDICALRDVISSSFLTRLSIVRLAISSASISDSFP